MTDTIGEFEKKVKSDQNKYNKKPKGPQGRAGMGEKKEKPKMFIIIDGKQYDVQNMAKGGRAGFKMGSGKCKLAKRGKGRAYGKNS